MGDYLRAEQKTREGGKRVALFVDNANLYHGLVHHRLKIDYSRLLKVIKGGRRLAGARLYTGVEETIDRSARFFLKLVHSFGFDVITRPLVKQDRGRVEKEIDVLIAVDMVRLAFEDGYDVAALLSGDGDFTPAVESVLRAGKLVEVWSFDHSLSRKLRETVGEAFVHILDDSVPRFRYGAR